MMNHAEQMIRTMPERALSPASLPDLTVGEINGIQAELESVFSDEFDARSERFCDWLMENKRVRQDYIQYRIALASDDELLAAERILGIRQ